MLSCRDAHALGRSDCPPSRPHTSPALTHIDAATCSIFRFRGTRPAPHLPQLGRVSVRAGVHGGCRPGGTRQGWARTVAAATARLDDGACPSVGASGPRSDAPFLVLLRYWLLVEFFSPPCADGNAAAVVPCLPRRAQESKPIRTHAPNAPPHTYTLPQSTPHPPTHTNKKQ